MKDIVVILFLVSFTLPSYSQDRLAKQDSLFDKMTSAITANSYAGIHSILIEKGDKLVYERYFNGFDKDSLHDTRSSFKSITSLLTGIAIDKGFIKDVHQKVYSFFPETASSVNADPRKKEMTIQNLLEMRSGFDCDEWNGAKDCETAMSATSDWVKFALELPMKDEPGKVWAYTSCDPMILSGIISKASGMSIMDFAKKYLFAPMGITRYRWTIDPSGHGMTAGSFYIRPRDMVKIGRLVRDKGVWMGKRILSEKWLNESTNTTIQIPDFSYVKDSQTDLATPQPAYYGYYWYSETIRTKTSEEQVLFASGNGGQYIMIIKNLDLVVVFTQGNYDLRRAKRAFDLLIRYILPAF